jgi:hypothetical protein
MIEIMDTLVTALKMQTNMVRQQSSMVIDPNRAPMQQTGPENGNETETQENHNGSGGNPGGDIVTG